MTYHDDQRRRFDEAPVDRRPPPDSGMSWGLPLGLAGVVIVLGLIFYNASHERTTTASNMPGTVQSTSSGPASGASSTQPAAPQAPSR